MQGGLVAASRYKNYTGTSNGPCVYGLPIEDKSHVENWKKIPPGDEEFLKCHVALIGPVVVGISVNGTQISSYKTGIYDDHTKECKGKPADHLVTLVGYGSGYNRRGEFMNFWVGESIHDIRLRKKTSTLSEQVVQNSWGSSWGEDGNTFNYFNKTH